MGLLVQAAAAKTAVSEAAASCATGLTGVEGGGVGCASGFTFVSTGTDYVSSISVAQGGTITVATQSTGASADPSLTFTPTQASQDDPVTWICSSTAAKPSHVPATCR